MITQYQPGSIVKVRNRQWIVLPSPDADLIMLKPLGGSEEEVTGIYLPLMLPGEKIESGEFEPPSEKDISNLGFARPLYDATRLSFRNASGPFRSLAKLSFRPRTYQMVPLIMALKQDNPVRLLIADDVGVGKTLEALMIVKELLERKEIKRFAILALPHLCEQWQSELKDKFGIDAVIIRSNTQAKLDREIQRDTSVYHYYPYQVISIDYIKSDNRRNVFIENSPELIIVDEVHSCSLGSNYSSGQHKRHDLIRRISIKKDKNGNLKNLILLTATPHSGKEDEFLSILGLLKPEFGKLDLPNTRNEEKKELAKHFIQRRRADIELYLKEKTVFPTRDTKEVEYRLSPEYWEFFYKAGEFALGVHQQEGNKPKNALRYWTALALLRGIMSCPDTGIEMLKNRLEKNEEYQEDMFTDLENPSLDLDEDNNKDLLPIAIISNVDWNRREITELNSLAEELKELANLKHDFKTQEAIKVIDSWLNEGFNPIIFCRYINTAEYIGKIFKTELFKKYKDLDIQVVTSIDPDEVRKSRIDDMQRKPKRLLIATDCLSEGINLQDKFNAILHYDLPWNPNRIEQREGRVDRFGQNSPEVKAYLLYSKDNFMDGIILDVLIKKIKQIRKSIKVTVAFPEESKALTEAIFQSLLSKIKIKKVNNKRQLEMDFGETQKSFKQTELKLSQDLEKAARRQELSQSIFTQSGIKPEEIDLDLALADEAIGTPETVERFMVDALTNFFNIHLEKVKNKEGCYIMNTGNLPPVLKSTLNNPDLKLKISFYSPTPQGYFYLGRNHTFVEQVCQYLLSKSFEGDRNAPARAAIIKTNQVKNRTNILLLRVRNVIKEKKGDNQLVAEEALLWAYETLSNGDINEFNSVQAEEFLRTAVSSGNIPLEEIKENFNLALNEVKQMKDRFHKLAIERSEGLVDAHERFRQLMGGHNYQVVDPVLPMDILGLYVLLPENY